MTNPLSRVPDSRSRWEAIFDRVLYFVYHDEINLELVLFYKISMLPLSQRNIACQNFTGLSVKRNSLSTAQTSFVLSIYISGLEI